MSRTAMLWSAVFLAGTAAAGPAPRSEKPNGEALRIEEAYRAALPSEAELAVFRLDWAGSLQEARERAAREKRPIFFVATTQLEEAGNLRSGHC